MAYASTVNHAQLAARLRASRRPFLTTHFKPDGDALGSVLALGRALRALGAQPDIALAGPIDRSILGLAQPGEYRHVERGVLQLGWNRAFFTEDVGAIARNVTAHVIGDI